MDLIAQFKTLVSQHFYDGTAFHRVNPETGVVQGGDPNSRGDDTSKYGAGDSDLPNVPSEFSDIPFDRGIVGGQPETPSLKRIRRQFDEPSARQRGTPIDRDPGHERLRQSGH